MSSARSSVRRVARSLGIASAFRSVRYLQEPELLIAQLTVGLDRDEVDPSSLDYRFGVAEALSSVLNALAEQAENK